MNDGRHKFPSPSCHGLERARAAERSPAERSPAERAMPLQGPASELIAVFFALFFRMQSDCPQINAFMVPRRA